MVGKDLPQVCGNGTRFNRAPAYTGIGFQGDPMKNAHYDVMRTEGGRPVKMWTQGVPVEESARQQLANTAKMPFIYRHVAVMPDVHLGKGSTIGSVIPTLGAVIPAAVGVDIGCGMMAAKTTLTANDLPDNLGKLRSAI